ncbi:MAG: high-potential iron-sulfur protein [Rhodospirillaceae bacterium]|nr:high-potential iron-sulfur protein [Rhodospirillaceae bacterium]
MDTSVSRRAVLGRAAAIPVAGAALWALSACDDTPKVEACAGPNNLTVSENTLRKASNYVEQAADPAKNCLGCGFFTPGEGGARCGKCEIFLGPVNAQGHCDSWAARQA